MSHEVFCTHCNEEVVVTDEWPHWWCCPPCEATGHTTGQHDPCSICDNDFSNAIKAIRDGIDARVIREGLICVKSDDYGNLQVGKHYKVISCDYVQCKHYTKVINDAGLEWVYPAEHFRSVGDNR